MKFKQIESGIGKILLLASDKGLAGLWFENQRYHPGIQQSWLREDSQVLLETQNVLRGYFQKNQKNLKINLDLQGTPFQIKVWNELLQIPYGQTVTYGTIASRIGQPKASRAVGRAVGQNPISIFVPCHRVVGSNGKLTGYAGGINRKQFLLKLQSS